MVAWTQGDIKQRALRIRIGLGCSISLPRFIDLMDRGVSSKSSSAAVKTVLRMRQEELRLALIVSRSRWANSDPACEVLRALVRLVRVADVSKQQNSPRRGREYFLIDRLLNARAAFGNVRDAHGQVAANWDFSEESFHRAGFGDRRR
jgi:hypothetical protein